jgi:hypothetical protein
MVNSLSRSIVSLYRDCLHNMVIVHSHYSPLFARYSISTARRLGVNTVNPINLAGFRKLNPTYNFFSSALPRVSASPREMYWFFLCDFVRNLN